MINSLQYEIKPATLQRYVFEVKDIPDYKTNNEVQLVSIKEKGYDYYMDLWLRVGKHWQWTESLMYSKEELENHLLKNPQSYVYEAVYQNKVVGIVEWIQDQVDAKKVEIKFFGLLMEYTGKGIGPKFMPEVLSKIKSQGYTNAWLVTHNIDSPHARKFYSQFFKLQSESIEIKKIVFYKEQ